MTKPRKTKTMSLKLDIPQPDLLKPRITIFGAGGAGGNAVNNMIRSNLEGVEFVAANTDAQALQNSLAEHKIQLGVKTTKGLGAGSFPDRGRAAAEENIEEIERLLEGNNMIFIAAGMGGGTGTGAAPVQTLKTPRDGESHPSPSKDDRSIPYFEGSQARPRLHLNHEA